MSTFTDILDNMREIHEAKNSDYSPEGEFGNFAEAERVGIEAWRGAFVRLQDKYTRACNLIRGKEAKVKDEALEDTLVDLANYAVICLCLRKHERDESRPDIPGNPFDGDQLPGPLGDHSERTAADELEETLLWRQKGLANHTYTDEEPEHRMRNKPSNPVGTRSAIPNLDNPTFEKMKPYLEGYVGRELGAPTWTPKDD